MKNEFEKSIIKENIEILQEVTQETRKVIPVVENGLRKSFSKQQLIEVTMSDVSNSLIGLEIELFSNKSQEVIEHVSLLLDEAVDINSTEVKVGRTVLTKTSFLVMIITFAMHQLNTVLKEEK
ncbi:hypothetical protein [Mammaliicoccus lentus]|uniref:hypothetical protein n=1 Tax=Mammaliicoccus lentus TaxID=42858 RepID=UPI0035160F7D